MILGIDTATRTAAIGIGGAGRVRLDAHLEGSSLRTRALVRAIDDLLGQAGASVAELTGVAVGTGPGSFTGLRVGIAAAQGIALGLGVPVVGVGTLECVARNAPPDASSVCVVVDAGRGEVFLGQFERPGSGLCAVGPARVLSPGQAAEAIPAGSIVLGDGWLRYRGAFERLLGDSIRTVDEALSRPFGSVTASLGAHALASAPEGQPSMVEPIYVRAPDAKLFEPAREVRPSSPTAAGG